MSHSTTPENLNEFQKSVVKDLNLNKLFESDPKRAEKFSIQWKNHDGFMVHLDYSKNLMNEAVLDRLIGMAEAKDVGAAIERMFSAEKINNTENRAVLHVALRMTNQQIVKVDGRNVIPDVHEVLGKIDKFSSAIIDGSWKGYSGEKITDVVNIGIGGSDLGPSMACLALEKYRPNGSPNTHFVSNIDGTDIARVLAKVNPKSTLFIICSKTFTTMETMTNANTARSWFLDLTKAGNEAVAKHFVAVSTNRSAVETFGIEADGGMFGFWDWVGGRYSVWSAVGLSLACSIGFENFTKFLSGARFVDEKFRNEPLRNNIPVIMALLGVWYRNGYGRPDLGVFPYEQYLSRFPAYLQQLDMESNGKSVNKQGMAITTYETGPLVWGEPGTNGQHSFFQKLHQGTDWTPSDFICFKKSLNPLGSHHKKLLANCFGQTKALMKGKDIEEVKKELKAKKTSEEEISRVAESKVFSGNRPSNTLVMNILSPEALGALIAIYEHKVYVQGVIWNVNSFDQMGVELGKQEATLLEPLLEDHADLAALDSSTRSLIQLLRE